MNVSRCSIIVTQCDIRGRSEKVSSSCYNCLFLEIFQACLCIAIFFFTSFIHTFSNTYQFCSKCFLHTTETFSCFKTVKQSSFLHVFKLYTFYIPLPDFQYAPSVIIPISCQSINISWNKMNNKTIPASTVVNWLCSQICILGSVVSMLLFLSIWLVKEAYSHLQQYCGQSGAL